MNYKFSKRIEGIQPSAIKDILKLGADPEVISFGGGYPDPDLFPLDKLSKVYDEVITLEGKNALQYAPTEGLPALREKLVSRMSNSGINCSLDEVMIISGGQQGLDLVAKLFVDEGDAIAVENPTFLGALLSFKPYRPEFLSIPVEEDGMNISALEDMLKTNKNVKFIYTIPEFHNPTGVTMSLEKRKALIELANAFDVMILEDSPYREIRYEGEVIPSIKSMDTQNRVIHLGSFSKILCPGLRLGWVVAPKEVISQISVLKLASDTQTSTLNMHAVNRFMDQYDIDEHIDILKNAYKRKKDLMVKTIEENFPKSVKFTNPEGGLFTWLTFPEGIDTVELMKKTLAESKVAYVPGMPFFADHIEHNHCRVNYSYVSDEKIEYGMKEIGRIVTDLLNK